MKVHGAGRVALPVLCATAKKSESSTQSEKAMKRFQYFIRHKRRSNLLFSLNIRESDSSSASSIFKRLIRSLPLIEKVCLSSSGGLIFISTFDTLISFHSDV
jgi:hypothetical protein